MGRPRIHPEGTTPTERQRLSRSRRRAEQAGASRLDVMLSPAARAAFDARKLPGETDQDALERWLAPVSNTRST